MSGTAKPASGGKATSTDTSSASTSASTATTATTASTSASGSTTGDTTEKPQPGPQATAEGNTQGANPNPASAEDKTKPTDPNPELSVGADNPNQPAPAGGQGVVSAAADRQGNSSREAEEARRNGLDPAAATVGQGTVAPLPSEGGGFTPIPAENTGDADSDKVPYTQATQRLVPREHMHDMPSALGTIANIPPGSRPMMVDPQTGRGLVPPQIIEHDAAEGDEGDDEEHETLRA